ncbi:MULTISPECIES: hypothetical protein [unclassified Streptomyces]|uniref:hypothetical protein n=1 Tax=unclassified Streptomyces TaxID=2593676 RepID=UPI002DD8E1D7|nr:MULTISPECIES: hypothetical protein [unclassified Streptomyces]WSA96883.1 hypothetical protein OIE63_39015 [Streptomyces sp. NBC_01795]WSB81300.1 hypothetical protein OHB04_40135 [Streptomyces sp. NBC_01775]WSS10491.1 hypothetical protein OG533_00130 [Streptomyces sp. NBC_01186]WSS39186.1 hypothetical protein OG220_00145 [Streptomyces sp. NBC_01187]
MPANPRNDRPYRRPVRSSGSRAADLDVSLSPLSALALIGGPFFFRAFVGLGHGMTGMGWVAGCTFTGGLALLTFHALAAVSAGTGFMCRLFLTVLLYCVRAGCRRCAGTRVLAPGVSALAGRSRRPVRRPSGACTSRWRAAHRVDPRFAPALEMLLVVPEGRRVSESERGCVPRR